MTNVCILLSCAEGCRKCSPHARNAPTPVLRVSCLMFFSLSPAWLSPMKTVFAPPTPALHPRTPSLILPHPQLHVTQISHALTKLFLLSCFMHQTYKHITRAIRLWRLCSCQARRNQEPHVQYEHAFACPERNGLACPHINYSRLILCEGHIMSCFLPSVDTDQCARHRSYLAHSS